MIPKKKKAFLDSNKNQTDKWHKPENTQILKYLDKNIMWIDIISYKLHSVSYDWVTIKLA
ncbi:hypothetical protein GCM10007415_10650 [Parapedobacter pyrenivorans]|uniref:Uncharacterized protein n=1 Tax=Parapedobacter pyrenivorans TaxID=1305674 RepID=A0A917M6A7_9SPHI|nr:hypothetical protein GCM10007415_10650 [Parapedobacter pyrenivorans]